VNPSRDSIGARILRCFLPFAAGYFLSYAFRAVNAAIAPEVSSELGLDSAAFGAMTSMYFVTFALAQIPLGIALDRWGPRRTEAGLLLSAAVGAVIFSRAGSFSELVVGRALIGLGVSACLMAAFKANATWWDTRRLPLANGLLMGFGGIGAASATAPVEWLLASVDWRDVIALLAAATGVVATAIWFGAKDAPHAARNAVSLSQQFREVGSFALTREFWKIAALTGITHGTYLAYQTLWAGAWMRDVAALDRPSVAVGLALVTGAMAIGYPALGALADWLGRRGVRTSGTFAAYSAAFILLQLPIAFEWDAPPHAMWAIFGFLGCGTVLGYAALTQLLPIELAGRINATVNLVVFLAAFAIQWGVGAVLTLDHGSLADRHSLALYVLIGLQAVAWLCFIFGRSSGFFRGNSAT